MSAVSSRRLDVVLKLDCPLLPPHRDVDSMIVKRHPAEFALDGAPAGCMTDQDEPDLSPGVAYRHG